jgi:hypothetical protein
LKKEREREKRGGVHQTNTNYHLLEVLVFWGVGSKVLVLVLVCSKKRRGRDKIKSTGNEKRFPRRSMAEITAAEVLIPM